MNDTLDYWRCTWVVKSNYLVGVPGKAHPVSNIYTVWIQSERKLAPGRCLLGSPSHSWLR